MSINIPNPSTMSPPVAGSVFGTGVAGEEQRAMPGPDQQARTNTESAFGTSKTNVAFGRILASFCRETRILAEKFDWAIEISGI